MSVNSIRQSEEFIPDFHVIAQVVDNEDPDKQQRIRVTIPKWMEGPKETLPWLKRGFSDGSRWGETDSVTSIQVPRIGSYVTVRFQNADFNLGVYEGTPTGKRSNSACEAAQLNVNYPNRHGYVDPKGTVKYVDVTSGQEETSFKHFQGHEFTIKPDSTIFLHHKSGTEITISPNGAVHIVTVQKTTWDARDIEVNATDVTWNTQNFTINNGSSIHMTSGTTTIDSPTNINGDTDINGNVSTQGGLTNNGTNVGSSHRHSGVRGGIDKSGPPV